MTKRHALNEYVSLLKDRGLLVCADLIAARDVEGLTFDDREAAQGTLFICKGAKFREEYLINAYKNGAFAYISERGYSVPGGIIVTDVRKAMAYCALLFTNDAASTLHKVGITGTKGKSTTAFFVKNALDCASGGKCGIVSTILNYDGGESKEAELSTPESVQLNKIFASAREHGLEYFVTEVSSQALKYDRVLGIDFEVGCFTNLGRDHISPAEHGDMEDYFGSKLKIFDSCGCACINSGMLYFDRALERAKRKCERVLTFGFKETDDIYCKNVKSTRMGVCLEVRTPYFERVIQTRTAGIFNAENALAAIACCVGLGIGADDICRGIENTRVDGRMEIYTSADGLVNVVVDYAHNGMSLEALLTAVEKEFPGVPVVTVFGCPGGKAPDRRREMGEISARRSALTVITEDDEGDEPLEDICAEIARHVKANGGEYVIIPDREEAIKRAVFTGEGERVAVLAGKGRETHQRRKDGVAKVPSDAEYAKRFIEIYDNEHRKATV